MTERHPEPGHTMRDRNLRARIRGLISPPVFHDEDRDRTSRLLATILSILIGATLLGYLAALTDENPLISVAGVTIILIIEIAAYTLLHSGKERVASFVLVSGLWLSLVGLGLISTGIANATILALALVITIAGLTLGGRVGVAFAALSGATILGMMIAKQNGWIPGPLIPFEPFSFWAITTVVFLATAGLIDLATNTLREASNRAKENERAQVTANQELQAARANLEELVKSRTEELQNRSKYLQATIEVSRAASSILDTDQLMDEAVELIRMQFELYYVGLFILDPSEEWAVLRAGTGEAGTAMRARGHRIHNGVGMVGWSIANAQARISAEIGQDSVRLATPELPDTRSEAAFPLRARGGVIGAMTIQSEEPGAFQETEISTFQTLADQIAIALENARLFSESRQALEEAQQAYQRFTNEAWSKYMDSGIDLTFSYDHGQIRSSGKVEGDSIPPQARGSLVRSGSPAEVLALPIPVREQVVGTVRFVKGKPEEGWTEDEVELLTNVVEQLGIALDSARLYDETRRRAERERMTGEIVAKMRASNDPQTILETAVVELRKALQANPAQLLVRTPEPVKQSIPEKGHNSGNDQLSGN